jgi:hypothetical protein
MITQKLFPILLAITFGLLSSSGDEGDGLLEINPLLANTSWNCRSKITSVYINLVMSLQKEKRQTVLYGRETRAITLRETTKRKYLDPREMAQCFLFRMV